MHHREFVTHTGFIGKKRISVVSTGIGTDNIDIVLNELDALVILILKPGLIKETTVTTSISSALAPPDHCRLIYLWIASWQAHMAWASITC